MVRGSRQLPLELGHTPGISRDDLVISAANAEAVGFVESWPDWPSPVAILAGPAGSGKTHLANIWRELSGALALDRRGLSASPANFEKGAPLLVEDADAGGLDETGLFHAINTVREQGTTMLITARRFAAAWGVKLPDLASRLKASTIVEIQEPDDALIAGVLTKLFADRQVEVESHVVQYIVRRIERSLATANAVVDRLDRAAMERRTRITRALAAEVVGALDEGQGEFDV